MSSLLVGTVCTLGRTHVAVSSPLLCKASLRFRLNHLNGTIPTELGILSNVGEPTPKFLCVSFHYATLHLTFLFHISQVILMSNIVALLAPFQQSWHCLVGRTKPYLVGHLHCKLLYCVSVWLDLHAFCRYRHCCAWQLFDGNDSYRRRFSACEDSVRTILVGVNLHTNGFFLHSFVLSAYCRIYRPAGSI